MIPVIVDTMNSVIVYTTTKPIENIMYFVSEGIFFLRAGCLALDTVIPNQDRIAPIPAEDNIMGIILTILS